MASIDKPTFAKMLVSGADSIIGGADRLTDIDSRFGDGDHGLTMTKIANLIKDSCKEWADSGYAASLHDFIDGLGMDIMGIPGGSSASLYGTVIGGLAGPLDTQASIDARLLKKMFASSISELYGISTARTGDKTMVDALAAAVETATAAPDNIAFVMSEAARGARCGAEKSKSYVAKYGRAKSYGDKTIGTPDAGATSIALFIEGMAKPFKS